MKRVLLLFVLFSLSPPHYSQAVDYERYEGNAGPGKGRHVVFLSGDEEYRSEEALPQMAKILSERHGFKCTVLFAIDPVEGTIDPNVRTNMPGAEALDSADVIVMALRFREWPDVQMKHFVDAYLAGKPIIALRTSTHAFSYPTNSSSPYARYSWNSKTWPGGFGKQALGETWVAHHGAHKIEATRGIIEPSAKDDPILRGVSDIFGNTDVYRASPPPDARILVRGQVLTGMNDGDPPVQGAKNDPMQPVAWTRLYRNEAGNTNRILCTTMGAATDLDNEGLRRLIVNAVYWGAGLDVPDKANVNLVGEYKPSMYGFGGFKKGVKPGQKSQTPNSKLQTSDIDSAPNRLALKSGDHVVLIGNALADRFQHSGWLETFIYQKYPDAHLVFRNLAVAGDEVAIRSRSDGFGSPEEWLRRTQADVIFAFFGFNESFQGPAGLLKFRRELDRFLKETKAADFSSRGNPRIVLFSPIANEKLNNAEYLDPGANNANIREYTDAMRDVAAANGVQFVELFAPSQQLFAQAASRGQSLTFDGLHLTEAGDKAIAEVIFKELFGEERPAKSAAATERLRTAVNEKNAQWHARYRTVDGNNVYGGRSALAYEAGKGGFVTDRNAPAPHVSNYKVMQEEMSQRDVMTANRDKRVWALAKGGDLKVDDSNVPSVSKLKSNHPGPNPDESFPFLGGEAAISKMTVHSGMKVNLFASEEKFPELAKPVQMAWDTKGRLWVAVWPNYPERTPDSKVGDSLVILEDTNGDGKADKCTHFIDDLNAPTGFQFYKDGVLVMEAPDLWFVRDTNGDGKADWKERVLMGLSSADSHHTANSICLDPGGAIYLSDGVFHRTQVETSKGPVRNIDAAIYRFEPRTGNFETYVSYDFANPHGRVFDYWGNDLITDGTGNNTYFGPAFSGHIDYPAKHAHMKEFWNRPSRPCSGTAIVSSRHFPEEFQGNFLDCNVIGFQGIYRVKVSEEGSGLSGKTLENLVSSNDPNFRPTAVNVGPDGAIYFADWQNAIIGHMQHHLRDPNRDHSHGRIYRITYNGQPLLKRPKIDGQPIPALLELLKEPEDLTRLLAKIELGKRPTPQVMAAVDKWSSLLNPSSPEYEHNLTEALWVHAWHNAPDRDLLERVLQARDAHARTAAGRVLCYWRDRIPEPLSRFKALADDQNPRVRLEAVRAASFFRNTEAVDAALTALKRPMDYYLQYTLGETIRQLTHTWRHAIESGEPLAADNPAGREYLLKKVTTTELLMLPRSQTVLEAIITRADAADADRMVALGELAQAENTNRVAVLVAGLQQQPRESNSAAALARLLPYQMPDELGTFRRQFAQFAKSNADAEVRGNSWAALALGDDSFDQVWPLAAKSNASLADLLDGITVLTDPAFRAKAYDRVKPLVQAHKPGQTAADEGTPVLRAAIRALAGMNHEPEAVFSALTQLIVAGEAVPAAARGLRILPRTQWPREQAGAAATGLVAWAKKVPASDRTSEAYGETVQAAADLAGFLPSDKAAAVRNELRDLRVSLFVLRTVREQMRYDSPRLVVEAGKPFEIVFENGDFMPHNLVLSKPDTRDKIGTMAAAMKPDELDDRGRLYIPKSSDILTASKMLLPGERESLKLTAPSIEGDYEYFCTFPGHYQVMRGQLVITKDVEAFLLTHPEAPLPAPAPAALSGGAPPEHPHEHLR